MRWLPGLVSIALSLSCRTPAPTPPASPPSDRVAPHASSPTARYEVALAPPAATNGALAIRFPTTTAVAGSATPTPLADADADALLARLEPLPRDPGAAPVMRPPSLAPARSGPAPQPIDFVARGGKAIADSPISNVKPPPPPPAPLPSPSISPTGEVRAQSEVQIHFDEAMVPIAAVGKPVPAVATITPAVPGTWRWIDTRVAAFATAAPRFPAATEYKVEVAAGTRALNGSTMANAVYVTFATPPVTVTGIYPTGAIRTDAPIAVEFDQPVDAAAIAKSLRIEHAGKRLAVVPVTLAEARERWARSPSFAFDTARLSANHVLLAPATAWPAGAELRAVLGKGARSTEGPRVTTGETDAQIETVPAFTLLGLECGDLEQPRRTGVTCPANSYVTAEFSTDLDAKAYRSSKIQIEGRTEDTKPSGHYVGLSVPREAGKPFAVVVADDLVDVYGQPLVGPRRIAFATSPERFSPQLDAPSGLFVLDPRFEIPQWVIEAQAIPSLRVELYAVQPADYFAFEAFEAGKRPTPPGKRVYDHTDEIGPRHGAIARVDLRPALAAGETGHVIAIATTPTIKRPRIAWIEVSKLGITARYDHDQASAWIAQISPAKLLVPQAGVETSLLVDGRTDTPSARTDAEGHAAFELLAPKPRAPDQRPPGALIVARAGADSVFTAIRTYERAIRKHDAHWYVTDDRFTYRPGETVYVKGWVRWTDSGPNPRLALPGTGDKLDYALVDRRGNKLASGSTTLTAQGGFDLEVALPGNANLGRATFTLSSRGEHHDHAIALEEFRTPTFAVDLADDVQHSGARPVYAGDELEMAATAKYYGGGGLGGARVRWSARLESGAYRPPNWLTYSFAPIRGNAWRYDRGYERAIVKTAGDNATLDGSSTSTAYFAIAAVPRGEPATLAVDASVTDVDRQTIRASSRSIIVHPSAYYVGLRLRPKPVIRAERGAAPAGSGAMTGDAIEAIVTDVDGNAVAGVPIELAIEGISADDREQETAKTVDRTTCKLASSTQPVACAWVRRDDRTVYTAVARVRDRRGRANAAQLFVPWYPPDESQPDLAIVPDRPLYRVGDTAKLAIRSSVVPATAVVTVARQGIVQQRRIELASASTTFELPIDPAYVQNLHVTVDRFAGRTRAAKLAPLPDHVTASRELRVDVESARLAVTARPIKPLVAPGAKATFEVEVRHDDKPVANAEVALLAVDEAVLALSAQHHADPLGGFYFDVEPELAVVTSLDLVRDAGANVLGKPGFSRFSLDERGYSVGSGRGGMRGHSSAMPSVSIGQPSAQGARVKSRKDFRATAVWSPRLVTDANGRATVTVTMPDSLTRFRIVALATANTRLFGIAESTIATQRSVNVRAVAPRFLSQGDRFALPVIVQNLDPVPRTIDVAVRASNLVASGPHGRRVVVPAGQRAELRFDFATRARGRVVVQVVASSGSTTDASTIALPVYAPATTESFATYGIVEDKPQYEQLAVPTDIFPEVGGIETELASTQLQSLTDAFWYLQAYPFECAEQRSGRMLATAAMVDVLDAFAAPGRPTRDDLAAQLARDVKKLESDQRSDGSWGYFHDMAGDPFVTAQVLAALVAHKQTGRVTDDARKFVAARAAAELAGLEKLVKTPTGQQAIADRKQAPYRIGLVAASLAALAPAGDVAPRAERLHAAAAALDATQPGTYTIDAKARVLALVAGKPHAARIRTELTAALLAVSRESAGTATIAAHHAESERLLLVSDHKTTALALDALMRESPQHPIIAKLARGLLESRKRGRWMSTQENLAVLQTMRRYFDTYEKATPSFTGKLWFGDVAYAEQAFAGRTPSTHAAQLPWSLVRGTQELALQRAGTGRMYYRIGITYAPAQVDLPALDAGFIVRRSYKAVDNPADVTQTPDGHWKIKLGARVLVTLETVAAVERHGVALVDPMPAGLEPVNTHLATSERDATDAADAAWDFTNVRDNRVEAFLMELAPGSYRLSYTARAATPGTFLAAPAKAEEMYSPETFGRSPSTVVVIQ